MVNKGRQPSLPWWVYSALLQLIILNDYVLFLVSLRVPLIHLDISGIETTAVCGSAVSLTYPDKAKDNDLFRSGKDFRSLQQCETLFRPVFTVSAPTQQIGVIVDFCAKSGWSKKGYLMQKICKNLSVGMQLSVFQ